MVVEQLAPLGRQLCEMVVREQLAPRRGANFSLHFRGVSNMFVFYAPRGANYAEFGMSLTTTGGYKIFCTLVEGINPN